MFDRIEEHRWYIFLWIKVKLKHETLQMSQSQTECTILKLHHIRNIISV